MIPAFTSAIQDRALRGHAREVYFWCHEHLDVIEYRSVKHALVAADMEMKDLAVFRSIELLLKRGYLDRGPKEGRCWTYRLVYSRPLR